MKKFFTPFTVSKKKSVILALFLSAAGFGTVQAQTYVNPPYYTGFESGTLGGEWAINSSQAGNNIEIIQSGTLTWNTQTALSYAGNYFLGMDFETGGLYNLNQADLHLDMSGASQYRFEFQWAEWNDESEVEDGIFISDDGGLTFTKVIGLDGAATTDLQYVHFDVSLDSINTVHGLTFSNQYIIRLQQYDNYYFAGGNDGFLFDELRVYTNCTPTASSITELSCDSYTAPDGAVYTASGNYQAVISNTEGCDSTISIALTITNSTTATINESALDSYTVPSGDETYTASGTYNDTIPNAAGCDSIITINLSMGFTGINEYETLSLTAYPNPANEQIQVLGLDQIEKVKSISAMNLQGQMVKVFLANEKIFSISDLAPGTYFLRVEHEKGWTQLFFIKM